MADVHTISYIWKPARSDAFTIGRNDKIQTIILHSACGHKALDLAILTGQMERKVSSHWYVTKEPVVYHLVADEDTAWHAGKSVSEIYMNPASIGIEQEHMDGEDDWPDAQIEQMACLCAFLLQKHGLTKDNIVSHATSAAPPGRKVDPVGYPWELFWNLLEQKLKYDWQAKQIDG